MISLREAVTRSLITLEGEFRRNELGYLALTTKVEQPIRDRWAFSLHKMLAPQRCCVAREWKAGGGNRVDLAILQDEVPVVLVELKAMYTFDAAKSERGRMKLIDKLFDDVRRRRRHVAGRADVYGVLLATHPGRKVAGEHRGVVKYDKGINRSIRKHGGADVVRSRAIDAVERTLVGRGKISSGELRGGHAFGVDVSVLWWLLNER